LAGEGFKGFVGGRGDDAATGALAWIHDKFVHGYDAFHAGSGAAILEPAVFAFNGSVNYCAGVIHPEHFDAVPYSMQLALTGPLNRAGLNEATTRVGKFVGVEVPTGNIVTVGSPNSNEFAFTLFGHRAVGAGGTEYLNNVHDPLLPLPVRFLLNGPEVRDPSRRIVRGNYTEPNWGVVRNNHQLFPERKTSGQLHTDFLVLTKAPNVFDEHWDTTGNCIFLISGIHGPGTQGFHLLLRDHLATEHLAQRVRALNSPYWQALIPVSQIGPRPGTAEEARDIALEIDDAHIELFALELDKHVERIRSHDWLGDLDRVTKFRTAVT